MCFGVCRHWFRLHSIAGLLLNKIPKDQDLLLALMIGLYQLDALRIPDYAVVQETVALMNELKKPWAKGLINAVLRRYCREQEKLPEQLINNQDFIYDHPQWLLERIQHAWPDNWKEIALANNQHPPMTLRVNTARNSRQDYLLKLQAANISATEHQYIPAAIMLHTPTDVHSLPGFDSGDVSVQDAAAQLAVELLSLKPGLRFLDACCAPGGKTCHVLEQQPELECCLALDIEKRRLVRVQENLNRLHCQATLQSGDASDPKTWWDGVLFDRILLDAPCSATGVMRRNPDIKVSRTPKDVQAIVTLQENLLKSLWPLLSPAGIMVYATCSILPEENEQQIANFLKNHPDARAQTIEKPFGHQTANGLQIFPGTHSMDGFYYCVLSHVTY